MDIRNFFKKPRLEASVEPSHQSAEAQSPDPSPSCSPSLSAAVATPGPSPAIYRQFDIGHYINPVSAISAEDKCEIFQNTWVPDKDYNFKTIEWLQTFAPWLAYSEVADGALCKFCVLFKQIAHRGLQGSFILKGFQNYKKFTEAARSHALTEWHKNALSDGTNLMAIKDPKKNKALPT